MLNVTSTTQDIEHLERIINGVVCRINSGTVDNIKRKLSNKKVKCMNRDEIYVNKSIS